MINRAGRMIGLAFVGAILLVVLIVSGMSSSASGQGPDPEIRAITATAEITLILSDTRPGSGFSRTLWFRESGVLTLTVDVTGTPPLTLTAGPAFEWTASRVLTASNSPAVWEITYTVRLTDPLELYTLALTAESSLAGSQPISVFLGVLPDQVPPTVTLDSVLPALITTAHSSPLILTGTFTDSAQVGSLWIPGSGVQSVRVLTAVETAAALDYGTGIWSALWPLPSVDRVTRTLRITGTDFLGNSSSLTRTTVIDRRGPVITWVSPLANAIFTTTHLLNPVPITGTVSDASGVTAVRVLTDVETIADLSGDVWSTAWSLPPDQDWITRTLRVTATDTVGNSSWLSRTVGVDTRAPSAPLPGSLIPTDTWHLMPSGLPVTWTPVTDNAGVWYEVALSGDASAALITTATGVTFPVGSGIYTVTLRAYDGLGNASVPASIGPFKKDGDPPSVSLSLPTIAYRTFPITITASDGRSGIISYTLAYTCAGCAGPDWIPFVISATSPTSGVIDSWVFSAPIFYFTTTIPYTFTVWVADQAGNVGSATGSVLVRPAVVALPLVLRNYCAPVSFEIEPNNTRDQANCVAVPSDVQGLANDPGDQYDWFWMEITSTGRITLTLIVPSGVDLDLYLQHQSHIGQQWTAYSIRPGSSPEQIVYDVQSGYTGRFYILVHRYANTSWTPYTLRIQR